jgi:hypothetical protein
MTYRSKVILGAAAFAVLATGLALLTRERYLVAACRTAPQAGDAQYRAAEDMFSQGNKAFSGRNYSTASDLFDMAASKLGDVYQMTGAGQDDTGMALAAGRVAAARSEFQLAAQIKQSAMATRLANFRRKQHLSGRCHGMLAKIGL